MIEFILGIYAGGALVVGSLFWADHSPWLDIIVNALGWPIMWVKDVGGELFGAFKAWWN